MKRLNWSIAILSAAATVLACGPAEPQLNGTWDYLRTDSRRGSAEWQDVTEDCERDDTVEFLADDEFSFNMNSAKCGSSTKSAYTGYYYFDDDFEEITMVYDDLDGSYRSTVQYLDSDDFVYTWFAGDTANTEYRSVLKKRK